MRVRSMMGVAPILLVSSVLSGCVTTSSTGDAPLNQGNWPLCSAIGGLTGAGLGAIEAGFDATDQRVAGRAAAGMRVAQEHRADTHRLLLLFRNAED